MRWRQKAVFWIAAALVIGGLVLQMTEKNHKGIEGKDAFPTKSEPTEMAVRKQMPELVFIDLDGKPWKLSDQRGRVVLLNFWAPWCLPCRKEMPALMELWKRDSAKGLDVVGVDMDEDRVQDARRFIQDYQITYAIVLPTTDKRLTPSVERLPTTFLIDRQGRLAAIYAGAMEESVFRRGVESLLAER